MGATTVFLTTRRPEDRSPTTESETGFLLIIRRPPSPDTGGMLDTSGALDTGVALDITEGSLLIIRRGAEDVGAGEVKEPEFNEFIKGTVGTGSAETPDPWGCVL